jgi:hypothetical protein
MSRRSKGEAIPDLQMSKKGNYVGRGRFADEKKNTGH